MEDLNQSSPLRALDPVLAGELGKGNLGIVIARHGTGKTPFLVGVALDHLLRGRTVLHVSLDQKVDHVREFYDQIFAPMIGDIPPGDRLQAHLEMERRRRIHTYLGNSFAVPKLQMAVGFMQEHAGFEPDVIVLDGCDLNPGCIGDVQGLVDLARRADAELWMSAVRHRHEEVTDPDGVPSPVAAVKDLARLILEMQTVDGAVRIRLLKPRPAGPPAELPFVLDPTTMLLRRR